MNDRPEVNGIMQNFLEKLVAGYAPQEVIPFGSYAYGDPTEDSDIDLLIVKDTEQGVIDRFVEVKRLIYDPDLRTPVSPLVYTPQELQERIEMEDDFV